MLRLRNYLIGCVRLNQHCMEVKSRVVRTLVLVYLSLWLGEGQLPHWRFEMKLHRGLSSRNIEFLLQTPRNPPGVIAKWASFWLFKPLLERQLAVADRTDKPHDVVDQFGTQIQSTAQHGILLKGGRSDVLLTLQISPGKHSLLHTAV